MGGKHSDTSVQPAAPQRGPVLRLIGGSAFIFGCRVAGAALTFASQILMARWMGATEFGAYVIAFSWCILLSTLATGGMSLAAIRFIGTALAGDDRATIRGFARRGTQVALAGGLLLAVTGGAALLLARGLLTDAYEAPLLVCLATVPFLALLNFYGGAANSFPWLVQSFLPTNVVRPLLFLGAVWFAAHESRQLDATQAMQLHWLVIAGIAMLGALAFHLRIRREFPSRERRYDSRQWLRTAFPLLGVAIFTAYLPEITVVLVGLWLPSADVAIFQVSYRIALLIAFGLYAVDAYTAPEAARLIARTDNENLQKIVDRATRLRFWPSVAAVAVLAFAGKPLLGLFGEEFVAGYTALMILAVAQLAQAAVGPVSRLMTLSGHHDRCLLASVGSLVVLVPLVALLTPAFGITGAAIAALIDMALWSLWMRYLVVKSLGIRPSVL